MKKEVTNARPREVAKEAIRNAAAALFAEKGYTATSTREICQRAGVTKPVLYYHFGNKAQLYEELVLDTFNEYHKGLRRASLRGHTPRERLIEVLTAMFTYARNKHDYWRVGFRMVMAPEKESPAFNFVEMGRADQRLLAEIIREGIRKREFKGQPEFIAASIAGMAITCILSYLVAREPTLDKALARNIIDLVIEGCGRNSTDR